MYQIFMSLTFVAAAGMFGWIAAASAKGTLQRNRFVGYRTRLTQHSDAAWAAAHKASVDYSWAAAFLSAVIAAGMAITSIETGTIICLVGCLLLTIVVLRGAWIANRAAAEVAGE
ncbi:SdpI family protein [Corynebacterium mendelii]